jgi:hypothetical protein
VRSGFGGACQNRGYEHGTVKEQHHTSDKEEATCLDGAKGASCQSTCSWPAAQSPSEYIPPEQNTTPISIHHSQYSRIKGTVITRARLEEGVSLARLTLGI